MAPLDEVLRQFVRRRPLPIRRLCILVQEPDVHRLTTNGWRHNGQSPLDPPTKLLAQMFAHSHRDVLETTPSAFPGVKQAPAIYYDNPVLDPLDQFGRTQGRELRVVCHEDTDSTRAEARI